jgi:hypothetical protein
MAPTPTTSIRHLQRAQQYNPRVRKTRYISFSKIQEIYRGQNYANYANKQTNKQVFLDHLDEFPK